MAQRRTVHTSARAFAFLVLATPIILAASPFPVHAQDVIAAPQTTGSRVQEGPAAVITNSIAPAPDAVVLPSVPKSTNNAAPPLHPILPASLDPAFRVCSADTDCAFVEGDCGALAVVNQSLAVSARAALPKCDGQNLDLAKVAALTDSFRRGFTPVCRNKSCELLAKPAVSGVTAP